MSDGGGGDGEIGGGAADGAAGGAAEEGAVEREDGDARLAAGAGESEQERGGLHLLEDRVPARPWTWRHHLLRLRGRPTTQSINQPIILIGMKLYFFKRSRFLSH